MALLSIITRMDGIVGRCCVDLAERKWRSLCRSSIMMISDWLVVFAEGHIWPADPSPNEFCPYLGRSCALKIIWCLCWWHLCRFYLDSRRHTVFGPHSSASGGRPVIRKIQPDDPAVLFTQGGTPRPVRIKQHTQAQSNARVLHESDGWLLRPPGCDEEKGRQHLAPNYVSPIDSSRCFYLPSINLHPVYYSCSLWMYKICKIAASIKTVSKLMR